ncbi:YigZ family protein [Bacillus sp. FSL W7-1360]
MLQQYLTIQQTGKYEMVIQKSRFIAHFKRTETEQDATNFISSIKKEHWHAAHNCAAYLIGENDTIQKANDDGEPSGTAGVPMLEVLKKRGLKDTCVVVTRYFGGIKLGAGGLIRAYGRAVSDGLVSVGIVKRTRVQVVHTTVDYTWLGKLENELHTSPYIIKTVSYTDKVTIETYVEQHLVDTFHQWVTAVTNGQAVIANGDTSYLETPI